MNLIAHIDKVKEQILANATNNESEKLYYQTLSLEKLQQIQTRHPDPIVSGNLQILSPTDATPGHADIKSSGYSHNTDNNYPENCFGHSGVYGMWYHNTLPQWIALKVNNATIHKYMMSTMHTWGCVNSWTVDVTNAIDIGTDEIWTTIDTVNNINIALNSSVERHIQNPVTCNWIRFMCLGSTGSNWAIKSLTYWGLKL